MKVTIYDKNPGPGAMNKFLRLSWAVGCWFQKMVGAVDDYYGASSFDDLKLWLQSKKTTFSVIQYWGHGSPATIWLAERPLYARDWSTLKPFMTPNSLLWFRVCQSFQGSGGFEFSKILANTLGCTVAGHTRIIGVWQPGLYTRKPNTFPSWSVDEGTEKATFPREDFKFWHKHTIFCLRTSVPKDW